VVAYFFKPDRLLAAEDWLPCPSFRNGSLPATRLSASEMSYLSLLVMSDMVMAKPHKVQHTLRATQISQRFIVSFEDALVDPSPAVVNTQGAARRLLPYPDHRSRSSLELSKASLI
jgi:hypothetical protein